MKTVGIILEANPLHLGHQYFINQVKKEYKPDYLIAIITTSFSMRGDISVIDKFTKTKLLLNENIDLIIELPFSMAVQSADFFAKNCLLILNQLKITDLVFGSETDDIQLYHKVYEYFKKYISTNNSRYKDKSKKQIFNQLLNNRDFSETELNTINQPNFTLGFQYIKTILDNNLNINYHLVKRIKNNYHDIIPTDTIASATSIRYLLQQNKDPKPYINYPTKYFINVNEANQNLMTLIRYVYLTSSINNSTYLGKDEGINQYILNNGQFNNNYDCFIDQLKNKKYTISLIKRIILHTLLNNIINPNDYSYIRILGTNETGLKYLNTLPKSTKSLIFSNPNELKYNTNTTIKQILELELNATKLYANITNNHQLFYNEFKLPIRKEV